MDMKLGLLHANQDMTVLKDIAVQHTNRVMSEQVGCSKDLEMSLYFV